MQPPYLSVMSSPYRGVSGPLLRTVQVLQARHLGRRVAVRLPQLVEGRWWEAILHTHRERHLRAVLLRNGGSDIAVVSVPWHMQTPLPERLLAEEEPAVA